MVFIGWTVLNLRKIFHSLAGDGDAFWIIGLWQMRNMSKIQNPTKMYMQNITFDFPNCEHCTQGIIHVSQNSKLWLNKCNGVSRPVLIICSIVY